MFDDLINKDKERVGTQNTKNLIDALKQNIADKEQFIKHLIDDSYEQEDKIKRLKHELDYLKNL